MRLVSMASSCLHHGFVMASSWLSHGFAGHRSQGIFVLVIPPLLMSVGHSIPCPVEYFGGGGVAALRKVVFPFSLDESRDPQWPDRTCLLCIWTSGLGFGLNFSLGFGLNIGLNFSSFGDLRIEPGATKKTQHLPLRKVLGLRSAAAPRYSLLSSSSAFFILSFRAARAPRSPKVGFSTFDWMFFTAFLVFSTSAAASFFCISFSSA